jgi:hypothetical protein
MKGSREWRHRRGGRERMRGRRGIQRDDREGGNREEK